MPCIGLDIRRPLPSLGLGGAAPGTTAGVQPYFETAARHVSPRPETLRCALQPFAPRLRNCCGFTPLRLQPHNFFLYRVSKLPFGTFRPGLKRSAAPFSPLRQGCETVAASAPCIFSPKTSFYWVSKLLFGTFRPGLSHWYHVSIGFFPAHSHNQLLPPG